MTAAAEWRFRWLLEAETDLAALRAALRGADWGDARHIRAMLADLRAARRSVRACVAWETEALTLAALEGVGPRLAPAVALRLRGGSWAAAAAVAGVGAAAVRRAVLWLRQHLACRPERRSAPEASRGQRVSNEVAGDGRPARAGVRVGPEVAGEDRTSPDAMERRKVGVPPRGPRAGTPSAWLVRCRDVEESLRRLRLGVRRGLFPGGLSAGRVVPVLGHSAGYLCVRVRVPLAAVWRSLRRCGLRLIGPLPPEMA